MLRTGYDRLTFVAIGIGGVFGAGLRWAISRSALVQILLLLLIVILRARARVGVGCW